MFCCLKMKCILLFMEGFTNFRFSEEWYSEEKFAPLYPFSQFWESNGLYIALFCFTYYAASQFIPASKDSRMYWFHSLLLTIFKAFAGGCLAPMMLGKIPFIFSNEAIVPFCILSWHLVQNTDSPKVMMLTPFRCFWTALGMLFRTHTICTIVTIAANTIPAQPIYVVPLVRVHDQNLLLLSCVHFVVM